MNDKKAYKVQIFDEYYTLSSDEPEEFIIKTAHLVDTVMKDIDHQFVVTDQKKIAVLSAIRIASMFLKKEHEMLLDQNNQNALIHYIDQELSLLAL